MFCLGIKKSNSSFVKVLRLSRILDFSVAYISSQAVFNWIGSICDLSSQWLGHSRTTEAPPLSLSSVCFRSLSFSRWTLHKVRLCPALCPRFITWCWSLLCRRFTREFLALAGLIFLSRLELQDHTQVWAFSKLCLISWFLPQLDSNQVVFESCWKHVFSAVI